MPAPSSSKDARARGTPHSGGPRPHPCGAVRTRPGGDRRGLAARRRRRPRRRDRSTAGPRGTRHRGQERAPAVARRSATVGSRSRARLSPAGSRPRRRPRGPSHDGSLRDARPTRPELRERGVTTLWATRDTAEAAAVADHLVVMDQGRIVAAGCPDEVYSRIADTAVAEVLGPVSAVPGIVEGLTVEVWGQELPLAESAHDGHCEVVVRPRTSSSSDPTPPASTEWSRSRPSSAASVVRRCSRATAVASSSSMRPSSVSATVTPCVSLSRSCRRRCGRSPDGASGRQNG